MSENFRQFLERLRSEKELIDIKQPVDIRHIATLVDQSEHALWFHNVIGYDIPVVSGIIRTKKRAAMGMGVTTGTTLKACSSAASANLCRRAISKPRHTSR